MSDELKLLLDEWKALETAATEGPWFADGRCLMHDVRYDDFEYRESLLEGTDGVDVTGWCEHWADTKFIAASRTIVPRLIAAVEAVLDRVHMEQDDADRWDLWESWDRGYNTALGDVEDLIRAALIGDDDE